MIEYTSHFRPSRRAEEVLRSGRIIGEDETPADMVSRVTNVLATQEAYFSGQELGETFAHAFGTALDKSEIVMSTPILTNAGRHLDKPLTACAVPTIEVTPENLNRLRSEVISLHEQGMGTGFNLDETTDPVATLRFLNDTAIESANSGKEDRPVGNMAVLSIRHPKIREFINAKIDAPHTGADWKFNISVNVDDDFMLALDSGDAITLHNGVRVSAETLFDEICTAAAASADPGIVFLDRMNARNPLPALGEYKTTAPCAEVGLIEGETCQFGYINLSKFVSLDSDNRPSVHFPRLEEITLLMTRALDNSMQISQGNLGDLQSHFISTQKRKIGIGLCGIADALSIVGLPYDHPDSRQLMQDMLSFVNFASKEASIRLAEERGSFGAMNMIVGNRHREDPGLIETLYGNKDTSTVSGSDWRKLSDYIRESKTLRNVSTIALPPTGRSALVIDASTGIEPHFDTFAAHQDVTSALVAAVRRKHGIDLNDPSHHSPEVRRIIASAHAISSLGHIGMVAAMQEFTDEAVAKTINLPKGSSPSDVRNAYLEGYRSGMSGVTVYVDGTHKTQPKEVR